MAKRRVRKSKQAGPDAAGVKPEIGKTVPPDVTPVAGAVSAGKPKVDRKVRKHLRQIERQVADAAQAEARRVRRLEKARWRRQRLEAALDEARTLFSAKPPKAAKAPKPATKPAAKAAPKAAKAPKPAAKAAEAATKPAEATKPAVKPAVKPAAKAAVKPAAKAAVKPAAKPAAKPAVKPATKPAAKSVVTPAAETKSAPTAPNATAKAATKSSPSRAAAAPATAGGQPVEAYCLREKKRVQMVDPKPVVTANGGSALSGTCPSCGAALYKLVSRTAR